MKTNASMGAIANILCGIAGAFVGGFIAQMLGRTPQGAGFHIEQLIFGIIGACIVIAIVKMLTGRRAV
ncbi:MAG TPA: GlsB/YeaQ/YmgE family stress response membrane protein [Abditibacteriaceae bacterium]